MACHQTQVCGAPVVHVSTLAALGPRWGRVRVRKRPKGHGAKRQGMLLYCTVSSVSVAMERSLLLRFGQKGSEIRFNGGWLLISNQHTITMSTSRVISSNWFPSDWN